MPSFTPRQHRAMAAAAAGHSTIGIPKKVGQEFVAADKKKKKKPITLTRISKNPNPETVLS